MAALFGKKKWKKPSAGTTKRPPIVPKATKPKARGTLKPRATTRPATKARTAAPKTGTRKVPVIPKTRATRTPVRKTSAGTRATAAPRKTAATSTAGQQNGLFVSADGRVYLYHKTMGWKLMTKKSMDAAVKALFGSR